MNGQNQLILRFFGIVEIFILGDLSLQPRLAGSHVLQIPLTVGAPHVLDILIVLL